MTFKEIYEEAARRGFTDMLTDATQLPRLKRYVNQAYREITDVAHWPFLEAGKEGPAPLAITDLGHTLSVTNKTAEEVMQYMDRRQVVERDPALTDTGVGVIWFRASESSIAVYPLDTASTFIVRYLKVPADLVADADVPILPPAYHDVIVDGTVIRLLKNRDSYEAAQFVRQEWERGIQNMKHALLRPNYDGDRRIVRTGSPGDYLG